PVFATLRNRFRVIGHETGRNKLDPELGVYSLSGDFELGRIRLPYGDADGRRVTEYLVNEALAFPYGDTDDVLMSLWFIKARHRALMPTVASDAHMDGFFGRRPSSWGGLFRGF